MFFPLPTRETGSRLSHCFRWTLRNAGHANYITIPFSCHPLCVKLPPQLSRLGAFLVCTRNLLNFVTALTAAIAQGFVVYKCMVTGSGVRGPWSWASQWYSDNKHSFSCMSLSVSWSVSVMSSTYVRQMVPWKDHCNFYRTIYWLARKDIGSLNLACA